MEATARTAGFIGQIDIAGITRDIRANVRIALDCTARADLISRTSNGGADAMAEERRLRRMAIAATDQASKLADLVSQ